MRPLTVRVVGEDISALYQFEVTEVKDLKGPAAVVESQGHDYQVNLNPGEYSIRVRPAVFSDQAQTVWSVPKHFFVPLRDPSLESPKIGKRIYPLSANDTNVEFIWKKIEGADYYKIYVFGIDENSDVKLIAKPDAKLAANLKATEEHIMVTLPNNGSYRWIVRAFLGERKAAKPLQGL